MPMWIAAFCHVIQKQSDSRFNMSLLAGQLCHYEDWRLQIICKNMWMCLYKHREDVYIEIWCRLNGSEALTSLFHETLIVIILFTQQLNCIPVKYRCVYCVRIRTMNKCLRVSPYSPHHVFLNPPCPVYTSSVSVLTRPLTFVQSSSLFSAFNLSVNITE